MIGLIRRHHVKLLFRRGGGEKSFGTSVQFMTVPVYNLQAIKTRPGGGPKRQNAVVKMETNNAVPHCYPTR